MTISGRTIAKNAGFLMASQLITWGLTFLLTIFLPRYLGPEGIGQLQLANSLWAILAVIAALGTDTLVMKEIARSPDRLNELVSTTQALRALIFIFGALGMAAYLQFAGYSIQTISVIWIVGFAALIRQLSTTYEASLKGLESMAYTSLASVVSVALVSFLQIVLVLLGYSIIYIAAVGIIASMASLTIQGYFLRKRFSYRFSINWRLARAVIRTSLPYLLVSAGMVLYQQVDTVIISLLVDEKTVGWYGAADRLFGTLLFVPNVFMVALFPALTRSYSDSMSASRRLAQKSLNLLILFAVPVGLGILVIADHLVVLLFGPAFANTGPVLAVMGGFMALTYINMLLGFLLISMDRQKVWGPVILLATLATIPLDLILIPWTVKTFANGALGGALSYAFTEFGMIVVGFALLPRGTFIRENGKVIGRLILAGCVMAGVIWPLRGAFILIPIALGAVTYLIMIVILRAIPKEDWDFFFEIGSSFSRRLLGRFAKAAV